MSEPQLKRIEIVVPTDWSIKKLYRDRLEGQAGQISKLEKLKSMIHNEEMKAFIDTLISEMEVDMLLWKRCREYDEKLIERL